MKITKIDSQNKQEINLENCLMMKKISKENMKERDIEICLMKINKN